MAARPRRVFLNNIDSFSSKNIAQVLSGARAPEDDEDEEEEDEEEEDEEDEEGEEPHLRRPAGFQVVGTVGSAGPDQTRTFVLEEYVRPSRDELLSKLLDCDVVVYNISQDAEQVEEAGWAAAALHGSSGLFSGPKMFVLVSTVMTWAWTKPPPPLGPSEGPELPLSDEIFWSRKAHPNFRKHIDLEKKLVQLGKKNRPMFSTYVVASGLQFGMGEQVFQTFFKRAWLGQEPEVLIYGDGKNIVPTIHIRDLASVVLKVIQKRPEPYYLLAVDQSHNSMEDIMKAVSSALGSGKVQTRSWEEALLLQDMSVQEVDSLLVNLQMEASLVSQLFSINWWCPSGLVENIQQVVEEYRQNRQLLPIRVCVLGPPAVGKTTVSRRICDRYHLHRIVLQEVVAEAVAQLEDDLTNPNNDLPAAEVQERLNALKEGSSEEQLLVLKDKLRSNPCRNQGFVLDGFPDSYDEATELLCEDEDELSDSSSESEKIMPAFVVFLDAPDEFLLERVVNLPEQQIQRLHYEPEAFQKRLSAYRLKAAAEQTTATFFLEQDVSTLTLDVSGDDPEDLVLYPKIYELLGSPWLYAPSSEEQEEVRRRVEESMRKEAQEKEEEQQREEEESRRREACWEDWTLQLKEVKQQELQNLEVQSARTRSYLMEHVTPTVVQGLLECCQTRPDDPVDFLAEFLFKNDPFSYGK